MIHSDNIPTHVLWMWMDVGLSENRIPAQNRETGVKPLNPLDFCFFFGYPSYHGWPGNGARAPRRCRHQGIGLSSEPVQRCCNFFWVCPKWSSWNFVNKDIHNLFLFGIAMDSLFLQVNVVDIYRVAIPCCLTSDHGVYSRSFGLCQGWEPEEKSEQRSEGHLGLPCWYSGNLWNMCRRIKRYTIFCIPL